MRVSVLGIGDAFTSRFYNTSFLLDGGSRILVDGPQALFRLLRERGVARESLNAVLVTHIHGDHCSGIETLLLWRRFHLGQKTVLYTSREVFREMREKFFPSFSAGFSPDLRKIRSAQFEDYVEFRQLDSDKPTELDSQISVEIRKNWHPTPTLGLKFLEGERSVSISGDTCFRPDLLKELRDAGTLSEAGYQKLAGRWLWDADLIYHEVTRVEGTGHTHESDLLSLPEYVRKKIRLVHVSDDFREGPLPRAQEGETVTVSDQGIRVLDPSSGRLNGA